MSLSDDIVGLIAEILQLDGSVGELQEDSPLLGALPEFDSMAVVTVLTCLEEQYDIVIDDDEVTADIFETVGSLVRFVATKV